MFIKDKAKIPSKVSGINRRIAYFSKLLFVPMRRNSVLEELRVDRLAVIHDAINNIAIINSNNNSSAFCSRVMVAS